MEPARLTLTLQECRIDGVHTERPEEGAICTAEPLRHVVRAERPRVMVIALVANDDRIGRVAERDHPALEELRRRIGTACWRCVRLQGDWQPPRSALGDLVTV